MSRKIKKSQEIEFDVSDYELTERDKNLLNLLIKFPELRDKQLAEYLRITPEQFSKIKNKPAVQKAFNDYKTEEAKSWIQVIIDARKKAALKLVKHISNNNPNASLRAIENILQLDKLDLSDDKPEEEPY